MILKYYPGVDEHLLIKILKFVFALDQSKSIVFCKFKQNNKRNHAMYFNNVCHRFFFFFYFIPQTSFNTQSLCKRSAHSLTVKHDTNIHTIYQATTAWFHSLFFYNFLFISTFSQSSWSSKGRLLLKIIQILRMLIQVNSEQFRSLAHMSKGIKSKCSPLLLGEWSQETSQYVN